MTDIPGGITYVREPILQEREKTHGDFKEQSAIWNRLWDAIPEVTRHNLSLNSRQWLALDMIMVKISRIAAGSTKHKDHWTDIAGYAKLGEEACD